MPTRRQFLLAGALGFAATPVLADFGHPVHAHAAKIEARLKVWRDHVEAQHDYLLKSRESHIVRWREWSGKIPSKPEADLVAGVNKLINEVVQYKSDYAVHGTSDFWATISDTLIHGGDCEDYALAKATTLAFHGWPENRNHLVVGMLHHGGKSVAHAVLVAERSDGSFWVLDNLAHGVIPAAQMHMTPLYGVDSEGVWLFARSRAG
ncbi:MAG: transglutaminase-like cysteine peptidase [Proteobacteria bacterium]|nr:transglutaminase-like cysteine peptidase [Pseudomonadota bacterium]